MTDAKFHPHQEKRFAVVMYGGVSLAIYINGVAQELFRLVQSTASGTDTDSLTGSAKIYWEIAEKLGARYVVDILSGTSAGGINAVFLAKALANDESFDILENLWIKEADISLLINDRASKDGTKSEKARKSPQKPTSLLNGARMYEKLLQALSDMTNKRSGSGQSLVEDLDLFVTATDLQGLPVPIRLADRVVYERKHRHVFHFKRRKTHNKSEIQNDFADQNNEILAFASRCTSSFPLAFEPVLLKDYSLNPGKWKSFFDRYLTNPEGDTINYDTRAFADGGYLDNKPFTYAIKTISERHSDIPTDRKLLYIEPSPEEIDPIEKTQEPPDAIGNVIKALSLARYETISQDLELIRDRNRLLERAERILHGTDDDINRLGENNQPMLVQDWFSSSMPKMIEQHGVAYGGYLRLRVARLTDDLSEIIAAQAGFNLDSDEFLAIRYMIRVWRDQRYSYYDWESNELGPKSEKRKYFTRFIWDFDLGFHIRRLGFAIRKIDNLLVMNDDGKQIYFTREIPKSMNENSEFRDELLRLRDALSRAREGILSQKDELRHAKEGLLSEKIREVGLDRKMLVDILLPSSEANRLDIAGKFIKEKEKEIQEVYNALLMPVRDAVNKIDEIKEIFGLGKGRKLCKRAEVKDSPSDLARWVVAFNIRMFPLYDLVAYPLLQTAGLGEEIDPVEVFRVSPSDPRRLAGIKFGHFGGFFNRTWRKNDILRGRLDGSAKIIAALLPGKDNQILRENYIARAHEAIMEEIREKPGNYLDLLGPMMIGPSPEDRENFRNGLGKNINIEQILTNSILANLPAKKFEEQFEDFEVDRHVEPTFMMRIVSRAINVAGKIFKKIGDDAGVENGRSLGNWISGIGTVAIGLLDVLIPGKWSHLLGRRCISLLMLFGILLLALNSLFNMDVIGPLGGAMVGVSAFLLILSWFLGKAVRTGKFRPLLVIPVVLLLLLLTVGIIYTPDAIKAAMHFFNAYIS